MKNIVISIVTHNNESVIEDTLNSIINNVLDCNYKIVICDNQSKDGTIEKIKQFLTEKIILINNENLGFGNGHNKILKEYQADYYIIYNPDLRLKNNIVKELYNYMENNKDIGMVSPKITYPNGELQYLCKQHPTVIDLFFRRFVPKALKPFLRKRSDKYEMRETGYSKIFQIPYATGCFMFFRGSVLKKINGFDDHFFMYLEDADITRRANQVAPCIFYPFNSVEHLWEKGSHKSLKLTWVNIQSAIYYFNKWGWKLW